MKGKRYTTEEKIRILREEDSGKAIIDICREKNLSEVTFHRWKRQFGHMELSEARRLKELERENGELKKMLAESLLKNRVLEAVCTKYPNANVILAHGARGFHASNTAEGVERLSSLKNLWFDSSRRLL